ncbi:glycerophosphoryl diester phosphodiesterase membrane domain-containing protein [Stomatobaculum longum]|uniref:glycerophosphoryl diester phosphodiesterase membrane domain-containing protein n=1 Tax=Stomatobaculum longum TaxID=796942 RepID=UPI0028046056|nr:glycerophosphoryl diester phosphodiesterase membrane domain-containing protein [Stomatobaculum longum]
MSSSVKNPTSFRRFALSALPEFWMFQLLASLFLFPLSRLMWRFVRALTAKSGALTSSNYLRFLASWRAPVLLVLLFLLVMLYLLFELLAPIFLCNALLSGRQLRYRTALLDGLRSLRKFASPRGLLFLFYLAVLTPLTGVGFHISLTKKLYIPNFISEVIDTTPLYFLLYLLLMAVLFWLGYRMLFFLHAAILESRTPGAAFRRSSKLVTSNRLRIAKELLPLLLFLAFIRLLAQGLFKFLPALVLIAREEKLLRGAATLTTGTDLLLSAESRAELLYRFAAAFAVLLGNYLLSMVSLLCSSFFLLRFTRLFLLLAREQAPEEQPLPKSPRRTLLLAAMGGSLFFTALLSFVLSFLYAPLFAREQHTKLIAHRTGGYLAPENSVAGIVAAENAGAYGSETDVQRTSDSYYVINHDDNFKRLAGVNRTPQSMTFLEVRGLTLTDPHFPAEPYPVATLSDLLDACRGKEKLFIELKGVTADKKMADDVVRIVREKNMVSEVVIISLSYRVINYVETHYPEFDTGVLFFAGVGNLPKLNCDILLLEEESVSNARIAEAHAAGKQIGVWTVNDGNGLSRFLDSEVDYIITDDIRLAKETEQDLLSRTPYEVFEDRLGNFWDFMFF